MPRWMKIGIVGVLIWFAITQPHEAAGLTVSAGKGLASAAKGFGTFVAASVKGFS